MGCAVGTDQRKVDGSGIRYYNTVMELQIKVVDKVTPIIKELIVSLSNAPDCLIDTFKLISEVGEGLILFETDCSFAGANEIIVIAKPSKALDGFMATFRVFDL